MHPAFSIIAFTTLSGLGYGLAVMLGLGLLDPSATATKVAHFVSLALISAGLMSSTLHLGNPQRAWRALSQWRSSWLSREGVMAIITFIPLCTAAYLSIFEDRAIIWIGLVGAALSLITVHCTAMIYASLRSVPRWHTGWTPASYLSFALAGGAVLATLFSALGGGSGRIAILACLLVAIAWGVKLQWRRRGNLLRPVSTPETATGLGRIGKVRLFEPPHMTDNYLTREMGFVVARKHAGKLFRIAFGLGAIMPVLLLVAAVVAGVGSGAGIALCLIAALSLMMGLIVERWLFFAEARHVVMNYYGR